jgi:hypothetical protein
MSYAQAWLVEMEMWFLYGKGGKEMKPCEACGYRDRCQTKQYKRNGGCDLFWFNKKTEKEEK